MVAPRIGSELQRRRRGRRFRRGISSLRARPARSRARWLVVWVAQPPGGGGASLSRSSTGAASGRAQRFIQRNAPAMNAAMNSDDPIARPIPAPPSSASHRFSRPAADDTSAIVRGDLGLITRIGDSPTSRLGRSGRRDDRARRAVHTLPARRCGRRRSERCFLAHAHSVGVESLDDIADELDRHVERDHRGFRRSEAFVRHPDWSVRERRSADRKSVV